MSKGLPFFYIILCCLMLFQCTKQQSQMEHRSSAAHGDSLKLYFIALDDSGESGKLIGCNDSVVPVWISIKDAPNPVRATLDSLLSAHSRLYLDNNLYNAFHRSELSFSHMHETNSGTKIYLQGDLRIGGICDNPRIQAQLRLTAQQFSTVDSVTFFIDLLPLNEILSLK